jgi:hypothetical protein
MRVRIAGSRAVIPEVRRRSPIDERHKHPAIIEKT